MVAEPECSPLTGSTKFLESEAWVLDPREFLWSTIYNSGSETIFAIMPETAGTTTTGSASTAQAGTAYTASSSLPWHLIPSFKPGETCINDFSRRVTFLAGIWPQDQMALLAPRIAMSCEGSAFQKMVRLDPAKLKVSDTTGVALIVKTLGGVCGKTTLENRFERFERAIYTRIFCHKAYLWKTYEHTCSYATLA